MFHFSNTIYNSNASNVFRAGVGSCEAYMQIFSCHGAYTMNGVQVFATVLL